MSVFGKKRPYNQILEMGSLPKTKIEQRFVSMPAKEEPFYWHVTLHYMGFLIDFKWSTGSFWSVYRGAQFPFSLPEVKSRHTSLALLSFLHEKPFQVSKAAINGPLVNANLLRV